MVTTRRRRIITLPNLISVSLGVVVFFALSSWWGSYPGVAAAALGAGGVSAAVWVAWIRFVRRDRLADLVVEPRLGSIPVDGRLPTPTLTDPESPTAAAYREAAEQLEAVTRGQVLLVSSPAPGQGASTIALNIAISSTQAGRRVVLVDGDFSGSGLSRFGGTGHAPGLSDLACGNANLATASRMWALSPDTTIPFIPAGEPGVADPDTLRGTHLADAIDKISEHADLLLIDVPPLDWNGAAASLAAHADGSVLVIAERGDRTAVAVARERLAEVGAPVVAHIVNRAGADRVHPSPPWRRMIKRWLTTSVLSVLVFGAWTGYQLWSSWLAVERDTLDVAAAEAVLPLPPGGIVEEDIPEEATVVVTAPPQVVVVAEEEVLTSFLVVGSDEGGNRADTIILALLGRGDGPVLVSLPRDLYLPNRCTESFTRLNATLNGCGAEVNGPTLLALAVEDFTGVPVDHFALFGFNGFERIIDEVGGVEICVEHPVRDWRAELDLPAGCTSAGGAQALAWVRSRHTQELRDGAWRTMSGVNDLTRNRRQQDVILEMLSKLKAFDSPADLSGIVRSVSKAFTLDDHLGVTDAVSLAWSMRGLEPEAVTRIEIPVRNHTTPEGAKVLLPTTGFAELIREIFPEMYAEPV
ncbi:MAG: LCP family protein [Acidimicrobiia bacterium]